MKHGEIRERYDIVRNRLIISATCVKQLTQKEVQDMLDSRLPKAMIKLLRSGEINITQSEAMFEVTVRLDSIGDRSLIDKAIANIKKITEMEGKND